GVVRREAELRPAPPAGPAGAAHRPPVEDDEVPRRDRRHPGTDLLHDAGGLVAEEEGEVVVDPAFPVVEVGVADAARLHPDDGLTWARVGHDDGLHAHRLALAPGDDPAPLVRKAAPPRR